MGLSIKLDHYLQHESISIKMAFLGAKKDRDFILASFKTFNLALKEL